MSKVKMVVITFVSTGLFTRYEKMHFFGQYIFFSTLESSLFTLQYIDCPQTELIGNSVADTFVTTERSHSGVIIFVCLWRPEANTA